jgi:hypothetical protein
MDRDDKMPIYARERVKHAWLVDPMKRSVEVSVLEGRRWCEASTHAGTDRVRLPPFQAIEIDLSNLWSGGRR